jgi:3'-5' exoribonuclease
VLDYISLAGKEEDMEFKTINEFKAGERIEGYFIIKSIECKASSNGKKYFDLSLGDSTGEINAKLWEYKEEDARTYTDSILIKVRGTVTEWQGNLQLKIEKLRITDSTDEVNIGDFVPAAPLEPEFMYEEIHKYIYGFKNESIKNITKIIFEDCKDKLIYYPAAKKNHHSIRAGLLYHILTMLRSGEKLTEIYTHLNTDLLFAGVILHDLSKTEEMEANPLGIVSDYTVEGQLLGHITQGVKRIENAADIAGADKETTMLLQHMVLSHHYEPEYGSPVKPMLPEAEMLHYLDIIDARMFDMKKALRDTKGGEFSDRIWSLENRKVYKPKFDE